MWATCAYSRFMRLTDRRSARRPTVQAEMVRVACANCLNRDEKRIERLVVCGDFNVAPKDEDVHDPVLWRGAIMCSEASARLSSSCEELGLTDTLRLHHPESRAFSAGGITGCWRFRRIAGCGSMRCLRADAGAEMHGCRNRSRNAQRKRTIRSRAGLGGSFRARRRRGTHSRSRIALRSLRMTVHKMSTGC